MTDPTPAPLTPDEEAACRLDWELAFDNMPRVFATLDQTRAERSFAQERWVSWRRYAIRMAAQRDAARRDLAEAQEQIAVLERQVAMETIDHDHTTADLMQAQERERVLREALAWALSVIEEEWGAGPDSDWHEYRKARVALATTEQPAASGEGKGR